MAKSNDAEVIAVPNLLQAKVGGPISQADMHMIEKAEEALKDLRADFGQWLEEEVGKLEEAAKAVKAKGLAGPEGEELFVRAHDLRGLGSTYEFPIVTRLAASLAKMTDMQEKRDKASAALALAHVGAIRAALSQNIRNDEDAVASELAGELEKQSAAFAAPWKD